MSTLCLQTSADAQKVSCLDFGSQDAADNDMCIELYRGVSRAGADADLYLYAVTHTQTAVFNMTIASKVSVCSALPSEGFSMCAMFMFFKYLFKKDT